MSSLFHLSHLFFVRLSGWSSGEASDSSENGRTGREFDSSRHPISSPVYRGISRPRMHPLFSHAITFTAHFSALLPIFYYRCDQKCLSVKICFAAVASQRFPISHDARSPEMREPAFLGGAIREPPENRALKRPLATRGWKTTHAPFRLGRADSCPASLDSGNVLPTKWFPEIACVHEPVAPASVDFTPSKSVAAK